MPLCLNHTAAFYISCVKSSTTFWVMAGGVNLCAIDVAHNLHLLIAYARSLMKMLNSLTYM